MSGSASAAALRIRAVAPADHATIVRHRERMFIDAGRGTAESLAAMSQAYGEWLRPRLADGRYYGWLAESGGAVVGGLGMMTVDWPPHPLHLEPARGYLLDVYVAPAFRGRGIARALTQCALDEARRRGLHLLFLHATEQGRPVYAAAGFGPTSEMQLRLPD